MGKVKFGLRDFQYAVLGDDDKVKEKKRWRQAIAWDESSET